MISDNYFAYIKAMNFHKNRLNMSSSKTDTVEIS